MKTTPYLGGVLVALGVAFLNASTLAAQPRRNPPEKPRLLITADPELDDVNTLIRIMLYTTDFRVEGLIYDSSQFHWKGDGKGSTQYIAGREYARWGRGPVTSWRWPDREKFIDEIVDVYGQVFANLRVHDSAYPAPGDLKAKIKWTYRLHVGTASRHGLQPRHRSWWQYHDAGTYPGDITLANTNAATTTFEVPDDAQTGQTIHVILEGTDGGTPALTRYQRVVVTVQ